MATVTLPVHVTLDKEIMREAARVVERTIADYQAALAGLIAEIEEPAYWAPSGPLWQNPAWERLRELAGLEGVG